MPLTSQQKHYIKKNVKSLSAEQISENLGLSAKEVQRYVEKHWPKLQARKKNDNEFFISSCSFDLKQFTADNINKLILLFFLVLSSYVNSLNNDFVSDDIPTILNNADVGNLKNVFSSIVASLQHFFYFIAFNVGGLNPAYFRFFGIIFHLGSTFLIFIVLSLIARKRIAFFSAAIFAVHPILAESVAWISGMPYVLYTFFFLLSCFLYILFKQRSDKKVLIASYFSFLITLICSEKAVPLFAVFFLLEYMLDDLKKNWKKVVPYLILSLSLIILYATKISDRIEAISSENYQDKVVPPFFIQVPVAIANYLKLIVWPNKLTLYHTEMNFSPQVFILIFIAFILYIAAIFYYWKKNKLVFFGLLLFLIALSPTLVPLGVSWIVAERYTYLGSIGIFMIFAIFYDWLIGKSGEKYKFVFYGILSIIIISLSIRTIVRNIDWKDEDHLWPATLAVSPSGAPIHNNMGDVYARARKNDLALMEFKRATEINPNYGDAFHNLGNVYQTIGDSDSAIKNYEKALSINPEIWQSYRNLGAIYYERDDFPKAIAYTKKALELNPVDPDLAKNLQIIEIEASRRK